MTHNKVDTPMAPTITKVISSQIQTNYLNQRHDKGLLRVHLHQPGDVRGGRGDGRISRSRILSLLLNFKIFKHILP